MEDPLAASKPKVGVVEVGTVSANEDLLSGVIDERDPLFHGGDGGLSDLVPTALVSNVPTVVTKKLVSSQTSPTASSSEKGEGEEDGDAGAEDGDAASSLPARITGRTDGDGAEDENEGEKEEEEDDDVEDDPFAILGLRKPKPAPGGWLDEEDPEEEKKKKRAKAKAAKAKAAKAKAAAADPLGVAGGAGDAMDEGRAAGGGGDVSSSVAEEEKKKKTKIVKSKPKPKRNAAASLGLASTWGAAPAPSRSSSAKASASFGANPKAPVSYVMGDEVNSPEHAAAEDSWAASASSGVGAGAGAGGEMPPVLAQAASATAALLSGLGGLGFMTQQGEAPAQDEQQQYLPPPQLEPPQAAPSAPRNYSANDWARLLDDDGEPYYLHRASGETAWELPAGVNDADVLDFVDEPAEALGLYAGLDVGTGGGGEGGAQHPAEGGAYSLYGGMAGSFT